MNVSLTPELEKYITDKVESGLYYSASEVIRESLRLLREQDELKRRQVEEIRKKIDRGIEQFERGEGVDGEKFFEQLRKREDAVSRRRGEGQQRKRA
ncbi:MAG: type II toxin-antitoxin system ParD family antitoxin [Acidobacteria bacterium]|nr:type II toxin-antitoxin system ParD family antitoxin [Acidobacteriota bacterium]MBI3655885.1 type II toxin-antitoxin system ParD family antitoxin [Acidobacteriota bacterium]